ncbi:uncharacterized protein LOC113226408 [Hyposmocoma kahamanoa]|uniref:uncharacterized protein LOC113226408 n=1 Tax=Hyposmocoma kahamanoa TaxID=1477025 RepID=UPI000E6D9093|nr:uncharacterized protein LOC113226408 [Hyposmocoma kahamanoa]
MYSFSCFCYLVLILNLIPIGINAERQGSLIIHHDVKKVHKIAPFDSVDNCSLQGGFLFLCRLSVINPEDIQNHSNTLDVQEQINYHNNQNADNRVIKKKITATTTTQKPNTEKPTAKFSGMNRNLAETNEKFLLLWTLIICVVVLNCLIATVWFYVM